MISTTPQLSPATASAAPPDVLPRGERGCTRPRVPWSWFHGSASSAPTIAWEMVGSPGAPVIAVLGGISADRHVTASTGDPARGWWSDLVGPGRALDTGRFRVLGFDWLGGNGASSGPADLEAAGATPVDTVDQAHALAAVLDELGIDRLHALVGSSYGGMVGLCFAAESPERLERLVVVSAPDRPHPRATAWRSLQRRLVEWGQQSGRVAEGLAFSRGLAMVGYRSAEELRRRFDAPPRLESGTYRFPIEDYLAARGRDFAGRFSPRAFLTLSESIDLHRVDPRRVVVPTTVVAVRSDELVPVDDLRRLAVAMSSDSGRGTGDGGRCRLVEIDSLYGHDAFLKEVERLGPLLREAIQRRTLSVFSKDDGAAWEVAR